MTDLDVGRFIRLKAAIESTLGLKAGPMAGPALSEAAERYREQIDAILSEDLRAEFDALFPRVEPQRSGRGDMVAMAQAADSARARLLGIEGWLQGLVDSQGK